MNSFQKQISPFRSEWKIKKSEILGELQIDIPPPRYEYSQGNLLKAIDKNIDETNSHDDKDMNTPESAGKSDSPIYSDDTDFFKNEDSSSFLPTKTLDRTRWLRQNSITVSDFYPDVTPQHEYKITTDKYRNDRTKSSMAARIKNIEEIIETLEDKTYT